MTTRLDATVLMLALATAATAIAADTQTTVTATLGTLDLTHAGNDKVGLTFVKPYENGSTYVVYRPVPPSEQKDCHCGTAYKLNIPNRGGKIVAPTLTHLDIRLAIAGWHAGIPTSVTVQMGSQQQTVTSGATEILFKDMPHTTLPLSISMTGVMTINNQPAPFLVQGILPVEVDCIPTATDACK